MTAPIPFEQRTMPSIRRDRYNWIGLYDHGWWNGLWSAIALCSKWAVIPSYRHNGGSTYSFGWSWNMGWHLGRWSAHPHDPIPPWRAA